MPNGIHGIELHEEVTSITIDPFSSLFLPPEGKREAESELQLLVVLKV